MNKASRKQQVDEPTIIDDEEIIDDQIDDDEEGSVYDEVEEVDVQDDFNEQKELKDDEDDEDDEDDDGDDGDDDERVLPKKRTHIYHQIPDSTEIKIVNPQNRITSEYMTIYEYAMVVGTRATHISNGSILYTDPQGLYDPRDIAKKEINENKCPLSISRKVSPTMIEIWEVNEMIKPQM